MRNLKKFLALVLAMLMMVSAAVVSADFTDVAADSRYAEAINDLAVKGIVKGTTDTTFGPDQDVKRWQMALFVARAMSGIVESDADWANGHVKYVDVTEYKGAIEYVNTRGVINGWADPINGDPVFGPNDGITYVQALKMAVCALGYTEQLDWPWGYYNKAASLGLTDNIVVGDINDTLNRAETAQVIYNMIYAAPADGGLTMAETNFSIKTPDNTSLFVVVATPKQYYAKSSVGAGDTASDRENYNSAADVAGTWVGIQPLVNGVANGQIVYMPCEKLGIAAGEVEDYFNRTVELVNYDAATGEFTDVELGKAPTVVNFKDVTLSGAKIKVDGITYTPSTSVSGATLINEIVVYEGVENAVAGKVLPTDADGNVINQKGEVVARILYTNANGTKWYFDTNNGWAMSEEDALDEYGVFVKDEAAAFVKYDTVNGNNLKNKTYQLEMYDDNGDGDFERAVVRYIYMGVYYKYQNSDKKDCDGALKDLGYERLVSAVTYKNAPNVTKDVKSTGTVFVYTFNPQLNAVTVLDVAELAKGVLTKIDATGYDERNNNSKIKLTFDGSKTLEVAYSYDRWGTDAENTADKKGAKTNPNNIAIGATIKTNQNRGANDTVSDITSKGFLEYQFNTKQKLTDLINTLNVGKEYAYVNYKGFIFMIDQIIPKAEEKAYNVALMEEFVDFDFGEIYLDMYVGAEKVEEAKVTVLDGKDLSKLSNYKFSMLISKQEYFYPGLMYGVDKVEDAYEINEAITADNFDDYGLLDAKVAGTITDNATGDGIIKFDNGSTKGAVRADRLRTGSDTVFYFINDEVVAAGETPDPMNTTITVYEGNAGDNFILFDADTVIWADNLGYTSADKAKVVYVFNAVAQDFFSTTYEANWYCATMAGEYTVQTVEVEDVLGDKAEHYGYNGKYMYKYTGNFFSFDNASKITEIYTFETMDRDSTFLYYYVDENGVVVSPNGLDRLYWKRNGQVANAQVSAQDRIALYDDTFSYNYFTRDFASVGLTNPGGGAYTYTEWNNDKTAKKPAWMDIEFQNPKFDAEIDDGFVEIYDLTNDYESIFEETASITEITVLDMSAGFKAYTGAEACEYLNKSSWVVYCTLPEYLKDGHVVFFVANTFGDGN